MSNGDADAEADAGGESEAVDPEALHERLDGIETDLADAETEADLDAAESELDAVAADVDRLPEAGDEDEEDPRGDLEGRVDEIRGEIEEQRGPYAEDAAAIATDAAATVRETRWTEDGRPDVRAAVEAFLETVDGTIAADVDRLPAAGDNDLDAYAAVLEDAATAIESAGLDADDDEETIATLLTAAETLENDLDAAEEWDDLSVVEQLHTKGFYDTLTGETRKDYPPELSVVRIAESENDPETILLALDRFESEFMQEDCIDALRRMGPEAALDEMNQRAGKREKPPIEVLGKIGDPRALETLLPYIDGDANPQLQRVTLQAIGEIGDDEATQAVADRLVADEPEVRSNAARALGLIGDTRAIDPLADLLDDDDDDAVRASAAWALNRIGTERALEAAGDHADDRSFIVQTEAEKAVDALDESGDAGSDPEAAA